MEVGTTGSHHHLLITSIIILPKDLQKNSCPLICEKTGFMLEGLALPRLQAFLNALYQQFHAAFYVVLSVNLQITTVITLV